MARPAKATVDAANRVPFEFPFETYRQEVSIEFATESAARSAVVTITPLWDGRDWAVSSRWDDRSPGNPRMREVLTRHGQRGTFYLNGWFQDWNSLTEAPDSPYARALLEGGHSIGGHSLTHPWLSYCHRNRIFEEIAGVRMLWESAADTPVNSYTFSYADYRNEEEGDAVQGHIIQALERAGCYHVANEPPFEGLPSDLILSPILPADGLPIAAAAEGFLADPAFRVAHPILTYSMHAVYETPEDWAAFERDLDRYGGRPEWWYCNQNEYAAYRYQFRHAKIIPAAAAGNDPGSRVVHFAVERPVLLDLNDPVPLTFAISGVPPESVMRVECPTARCTPSESRGTTYRFHLSHDSDQGLPTTIGLVPPNTANRSVLTTADTSAKIPGVRALLFHQGDSLHLQLENRSNLPLTACRITYRLPPGWTEGIVRRPLAAISPGSSTEDVSRALPGNGGYKLSAGNAFLAAQIDFVLGQRRFRLHAACYKPSDSVDGSFPQSGFVRIGPIPQGQVGLRRLTRDLRTGAAGLRPWRLSDASIREWAAADDPFQPPHFDVERIRLSGVWAGWQSQGYFVLRSRLWSGAARTARLRTSGSGFVVGVILDGEEVADRSALPLQAGWNSLTLVCAALPAVFVRLEDPASGERLTDIRYERPELPANGDVPYTVPPTSDPGSVLLWPTRLRDGRIGIEWEYDGTLESAPTLSGPWLEVPSSNRAVTVNADESSRFFRLRVR